MTTIKQRERDRIQHCDQKAIIRYLLGNECQVCGSHDRLEIHHYIYIKGKKEYNNGQGFPAVKCMSSWPSIWEVPMLGLLCRKCHRALDCPTNA